MAEAKTKTELLKTARGQVPEVTPAELAKELQGRRPVVVDVREKDETDQGILPGSKQVPRGYLELRIEEAIPDRDADVVLYCAGGTRSLLAGRTLQEMGYRKVRSLRGGVGARDDPQAEPGRHRRRASRAARPRERARPVPPLRFDRRRERQLRNALPGERRLRAVGKAQRAWVDLPFRRTGDDVHPGWG